MLPAMIPRTKSPLRHNGAVASATTASPLVPVPGWLRSAVSDMQGHGEKVDEDVAIAAGAAIGALDAVVRLQGRWAGVWRQRLALAAAVATAKQAGRAEDEAALRDAVLLTRPGDSVGPAGLLFLGWRRLAERSASELLTEANLGAALEEFGYARDEAAAGDLADELRQLSATAGMTGTLSGAFTLAESYGFGGAFACWLADVLLAQRVGWTHAVPLLGIEAALTMRAGSRRPPSAATGAGKEPARNLLAAQARAALRAIDLSMELDRRAHRLLAVAPKLRAKASDTVVEKLLCDDAIVASERIVGISDRGLRRLFDRLMELDAIRELSGRPTFRIYGL